MALEFNDLLPVPLVLALLRLLRNQPKPEDEDVLFDAYGSVIRQAILTKASREVLALDGRGTTDKARDQALDAALVDMLRAHHRRREEARAA